MKNKKSEHNQIMNDRIDYNYFNQKIENLKKIKVYKKTKTNNFKWFVMLIIILGISFITLLVIFFILYV